MPRNIVIFSKYPSFYAIQTINLFLYLIISANHDQAEEIQPIHIPLIFPLLLTRFHEYEPFSVTLGRNICKCKSKNNRQNCIDLLLIIMKNNL